MLMLFMCVASLNVTAQNPANDEKAKAKEIKLAVKELTKQIPKALISLNTCQEMLGPDGNRRIKLWTYDNGQTLQNKAETFELLGVSKKSESFRDWLERLFFGGVLKPHVVGKNPVGIAGLGKPGFVYFPEGLWNYESGTKSIISLNPYDKYPIYHSCASRVFFQKELSVESINLSSSSTVPFGLVLHGSKVTSLFDVNTKNGKATVIEFFVDSVESKNAWSGAIEKSPIFTYGLISEDKLSYELTQINNGEVGVVIDARDGQAYPWTKIGNQIWLAANLRYSFDNQLTIQHPRRSEGNYYSFSQAFTACPEGWHLPSDYEWKVLEKEIGVASDLLDSIGNISWEGNGVTPGFDLISSKKLRFNGQYAGSVSKNNSATDSPEERGQLGYYWTSSRTDVVNAIIRVIGNGFGGIVRDKLGSGNYLSCRCVKDQPLSIRFESSQELGLLTGKINATPEEANLYLKRSAELLLMGEGKLALDDVNRAILIDEDNYETKLFKAQIMFIYTFDKDANQIRNILNEYTSKINSNEYAYYLKSMVTLYDYKDGVLEATSDDTRRKESLSSLDKALSIDSRNPELLNFKSKLLVVMGRYEEAISALKKELQMDPKNGDSRYRLALMKLKFYDQTNRTNRVNASEWCGLFGGCYKITSAQLQEVCADFVKARQYGAIIDPNYLSICGELKQAQILERHRPIVHTGPRGGRYTISSTGTKVYIPK